jgi:CheY-like chemotaxis protein
MTQEADQSTAQTILLVEDDEEMRELLRSALSMETDYEVLTMSSDAETLQRLAEVRSVKPLLFLLDFRLPTMTGLELNDVLHKQRGLKNVPAIIITAFQLNKEIERRLQERNITKLEKPFDLEDFLCYIEQTCCLKDQQ